MTAVTLQVTDNGRVITVSLAPGEICGSGWVAELYLHEQEIKDNLVDIIETMSAYFTQDAIVCALNECGYQVHTLEVTTKETFLLIPHEPNVDLDEDDKPHRILWGTQRDTGKARRKT